MTHFSYIFVFQNNFKIMFSFYFKNSKKIYNIKNYIIIKRYTW